MTVGKWIIVVCVAAIAFYAALFAWDRHDQAAMPKPSPRDFRSDTFAVGQRFKTDTAYGYERERVDSVRRVLLTLPATDSIPASWGRVVGTLVTGDAQSGFDNSLVLEDSNGTVLSVPIRTRTVKTPGSGEADYVRVIRSH